MAEATNKELILTAGRFAHVVDETNGTINCYTGPTKSSLSPTDRPVIYNSRTGIFENVPVLEAAIQTATLIPNGSYAILGNPARNGSHPPNGKRDSIGYSDLRHGEYENVPGPQSFALWPGQFASVIEGHQLGYNEYLKIRVYDESAAKADWDKSVIKAAHVSQEVIEATTDSSETAEKEASVKKGYRSEVSILSLDKDKLFTGQILIVKGTEVSFYIPPNGIAVIPDETTGAYVRRAVTLERLEYCILLDQSGIKRYVRGPVVVFPSPTEDFITKSGPSGEAVRKFKAYELTPISGLHIKVISDYTENGKTHKEGDELFITGKEQAIYFPREEHAMISYGDREIHFAIAIPKGEARYILNRITGENKLVRGEVSYLPDPRFEVVVQRVLSDDECALLYPGNSEAIEFNRKLRGKRPDVSDQGLEYLSTRMEEGPAYPGGGVKRGLIADTVTRQTKYTPPRTIVLDNKYTGAVSVSPYSGYAIQVVDKSGNRRVVVGPTTELLAYDERLEVLELSTGKPKNTDNLLRTVYLQIMSNAVTDIVSVETADMVGINLKLKYLVTFEGDSSKWFNVSNYIKYLTDHMRSLISTEVRKLKVRDFYANSLPIISKIVLDEDNGDAPSTHTFSENGMVVYGVDLLAVQVKDPDLDASLRKAPQDILLAELDLERSKTRSAIIEENEKLLQSEYNVRASTQALKDSIKLAEAQTGYTYQQYVTETAAKLLKFKQDQELVIEEVKQAIAALERDGSEKESLFEERLNQMVSDRITKELNEKARNQQILLESVQPGMIEALEAAAMTGTLAQIGEHLAPLALVREQSLSGTAKALFEGTPLERLIGNLEDLANRR